MVKTQLKFQCQRGILVTAYLAEIPLYSKVPLKGGGGGRYLGVQKFSHSTLGAYSSSWCTSGMTPAGPKQKSSDEKVAKTFRLLRVWIEVQKLSDCKGHGQKYNIGRMNPCEGGPRHSYILTTSQKCMHSPTYAPLFLRVYRAITPIQTETEGLAQVYTMK